MNEEEYNPYCEVCGHCGYIECCGIVNFIEQHIKGKTNCKNEECVIDEIISICDYETKVFNENKKLQKQLQAYKDKEDKLREYMKYYLQMSFPSIVVSGKKEMCKEILQILNEGSDVDV